VGREAHGGGAGFYFHFAPGEIFCGGGIWESLPGLFADSPIGSSTRFVLSPLAADLARLPRRLDFSCWMLGSAARSLGVPSF
jgi:hypothetical protein